MFCAPANVDDQGDTGATNSSTRTGKSAGTVQGLLQQIHHMPEGQDAKRESAAQRLQSPWTRYGSIEWQQREQSFAG